MNIAKIQRTLILKSICERLLQDVLNFVKYLRDPDKILLVYRV